MNQTTSPSITITREPISQIPGDVLLGKLKGLLSIDFNDHDPRLLQCIYAAKGRIEKITGVLLTPATVSVRWGAFYDFEELPWGPVTDTVAAEDLTGVAITGLDLSGDFPRLEGDYPKGIRLTYTAGYAELPEDLQEAVINLAANSFDGGNREWKEAAFANRRFSWAA